MEIDFLIIGQGLAGSALAYRLIKEGKNWKIAHYVLSMTIPNDTIDEVVKIKEKIENGVIEKLKAK